ncbi:MAG TPA: MoaD/ThiS family protein [Tissierellia bacterium]|nr:MoaD/ThiS family protein [Tissierellia bacterium]
MIIKISKVFLYNSDLKGVIELEIKDNTTVNDVIKLLSLDNTDYAMFFINDKIAGKSDMLKNEDTLTILPICDGG